MNKTRSNAQSLRFYALVFATIAILCALPLWHFYGHAWRYGLFDLLCAVIEDPVVMSFAPQPEIMPLSLRFIYTLAVASIPSALLTWLIYAYRHDYVSHHKDDASLSNSSNV